MTNQEKVKNGCPIGENVIALMKEVATTVEKITTADATDPATTQALANSCKVTINLLLDALTTLS